MKQIKKYIKTLIKSLIINQPKDDIKLNGYFYCKDFEGLKIYSHNKACIERAFEQIFTRHVYNFNSKTEEPFIIDAGANIGMAVLYWKKRYPKAKIIAFEPSREAYKSLVKNVEANNLKDVICIDKALSNTNGTQKFTTNEVISGSLILEKDLANNYDVETTTLGEYLKDEVDFLKIDIEGAEKLIYDDVKTNIHNLNHVFLEYHSFINENQYLSKFLDLFEKNNFRYFIEGEYNKTNHFVEPKVSLNQDMQLNVWAKKASIDDE